MFEPSPSLQTQQNRKQCHSTYLQYFVSPQLRQRRQSEPPGRGDVELPVAADAAAAAAEHPAESPAPHAAERLSTAATSAAATSEAAPDAGPRAAPTRGRRRLSGRETTAS